MVAAVEVTKVASEDPDSKNAFAVELRSVLELFVMQSYVSLLVSTIGQNYLRK